MKATGPQDPQDWDLPQCLQEIVTNICSPSAFVYSSFEIKSNQLTHNLKRFYKQVNPKRTEHQLFLGKWQLAKKKPSQTDERNTESLVGSNRELGNTLRVTITQFYNPHITEQSDQYIAILLHRQSLSQLNCFSLTQKNIEHEVVKHEAQQIDYTARSPRSDRDLAKLCRYVATEHAQGSVATSRYVYYTRKLPNFKNFCKSFVKKTILSKQIVSNRQTTI
ncbi:hypothetical protein YC2023_016260 [Brassica napus]